MAGFFNKLKNAGAGSSSPAGKDAASKKKDDNAPEMTPLERMLQSAGPIREDGSDKFFGLENFGNTCYCNSIVQALYYSEDFREHVVNYPNLSPSGTPNGARPKVNVTIRPPLNGAANNPKGKAMSTPAKSRQAINSGLTPLNQANLKPEDRPDSPEYKKKQAMIKGPILELAKEHEDAYGMEESTFTGLKDIFLTLIESNARTGVLSPQRFLEIFKRDNEAFRNQMHQDAHEFYGLVLNDVISNVEANARRAQELEAARGRDGITDSVESALGTQQVTKPGTTSPGTGWVHEIFEGVLTSETKCLTCETASQRDETFLDLSIDLEEHSSVTSCLRSFSAEEQLCERNKFHCDNCGGLQEAEKRMKLKRLPKVLALHLKRFKWTEDYSRLQKLFHRVVYPYHIRLFNTTDEAEDSDRGYELYAVVIHIGGNAYHGHYVSVIKTQDRGWLLFDDEMVEPVDKHFVRNFFGDKPGTACAYVLFYRETTFEKVQEEYDADGLEEIKIASQAADLAQENGQIKEATAATLTRLATQPISPVDDREGLAGLAHAQTAPAPVPIAAVSATAVLPTVSPVAEVPPTPAAPATPAKAAVPPPTRTELPKPETKSKDDKKREKKEQEAAEKARKQAEKDKAKADEKARKDELDGMRKALEASRKSAAEEEEKRKKENSGSSSGGFLGRRSTTKKSFGFLSKDKDREKSEAQKTDTPDVPPVAVPTQNGDANHASVPAPSQPAPEKQHRFSSFSLGRKKSANVLS